jgi:hypothetical protein
MHSQEQARIAHFHYWCKKEAQESLMGPAVKPASPKMLEWFSWQGRGFYVIEVILLGVRSSQALPVATCQSNPLACQVRSPGITCRTKWIEKTMNVLSFVSKKN